MFFKGVFQQTPLFQLLLLLFLCGKDPLHLLGGQIMENIYVYGFNW